MGRQSEADDDAAKAVISASSARLRQAPARDDDDDSFARPRQQRVTPGNSDASKQKKKEGKGGIALAPGNFSEESNTKVEVDTAKATTAVGDKKEKEKVCTTLTSEYLQFKAHFNHALSHIS